MRTGMAHNDGIDLYWIEEGASGLPALVLVHGAGSPLVMWCRELIDPILEAGYRVIRFDNRDVGRSTRVPSDQQYLIPDLAADLRAVMDDCDAPTAHLVGRSMGGMTIMSFAALEPQRVETMTLIYTTACLADAGDHGLPGPDQRILDAMAEAAFDPPPANDDERIERRVVDAQLYAGSRYPFDEAWARREAAEEAAHAPYAEPGHGSAVMASDSLVPLLAALTQPALVLHGDADPIIDPSHGRFLAAGLPNSTYIEFDGLGHEMPPPFCAEIAPIVVEHIQA
jgi:pimeloyl-ACP methyl ester carboxylesterase